MAAPQPSEDNLAPSNDEGISPAPAIKAAGTAVTNGPEGDAEAGLMPETKAPSPNSFSALKPFVIISVSYLLVNDPVHHD